MNHELTLSVLLVEDEALQRAGTKMLIEKTVRQARIQDVGSYDDAIRKLTDEPFDIAFLDYSLRDQRSGLDLLKEMRERELDTRAIMLSSFQDRDLILACIAAGACGYISKNMDPDGLFDRAFCTVFEGGIFLPTAVFTSGPRGLNRGTFQSSVTAEALGLKGRKLEALYYICQGYPNKLIARKMGVSEDTVRKDYNPFLFRFFGVVRRTDLMLEVSRRKIIVPKPEPEQEHAALY